MNSTIPKEIPKYRYHVSDTAVILEKNYVFSVIELEGVMFEAIALNVLENDFDALNLAYAESAKEKAGRLAFWTYIKRRKINIENKYKFDNVFAKRFADKYMQRFNDKDYFENKFYIAIAMKFDETINVACDDLEEVCEKFMRVLNAYKPRILSAYTNDKGILFSEVFEFLSDTVNNEKPLNGFPLTGTPVCDMVNASTLHFGYDMLQVKGEYSNKYVTMYDLKDYPSKTYLGMFNEACLNLPFEFNLVQSFVSLSPTKALEEVVKQSNKLVSAKDKAEHQILELEEAQGYIQSGELAFGNYHCVMAVFGNTPKEAVVNGQEASASFSNNAGAVFRRALGSAPASYFSQLPIYMLKPRPMMKSSRNLAGTFSMHNYSRGKATGNPLGDGSAIMPLETQSKTLYDFNFHFSKSEENSTGESIAGHTLILGATGTGKTTTQSALITFATRFNLAMFALDKGRGMDIFIRALDGDYFAIKAGQPTGINPFQFPDTPKLREFLNELLITCATDKNTECSSEEQNQIKNAVDTVMNLPFEFRRFSAILQAIPPREGNELSQRLLKWANTEEHQGRFAWALDNPTNIFDVNNFWRIGFDVTDLLVEDYQPSAPILACLFYMKSMMIENYDNMVTIVEEFWLPLKFKMTEDMILDVLKTGRKKGDFMVLVSQSPADAISSPIFPAIVEQTPTKIMLPNPDAEYRNDEGKGYNRVGLTQKEFIGVKKLGLSSRTFLVKQGNQSAFATLDLYGFDDDIPVLSSSDNNIKLLDTILWRLGNGGQFKVPSYQWLPVFKIARKLKKEGNLDWEKLFDLYYKFTTHLGEKLTQDEWLPAFETIVELKRQGKLDWNLPNFKKREIGYEEVY
ncbi:hypothetical protein A9299_10110 [Moraxella osloensis]|uniref:CagE TrbE VirB component of type IV transporter system central domain-containing protein n=1 Tax=Faucicola osloensis TaxID=34062 RepID=A0AA91J9P1_FAUOS|nr:hypothetical protein A9299_10110 [Moraxella osloensis]